MLACSLRIWVQIPTGPLYLWRLSSSGQDNRLWPCLHQFESDWSPILTRSSVAERLSVKQDVAGSTPAGSAFKEMCMIEHEALTLAQTSKLLGRNESEVRRLARLGDIPATKHEGKWLFIKSVVEDWAVLHPHQTYKLHIPVEELLKMADGKTYKQLAEELTIQLGMTITSSTIASKLRIAGHARKRGRRTHA